MAEMNKRIERAVERARRKPFHGGMRWSENGDLVPIRPHPRYNTVGRYDQYDAFGDLYEAVASGVMVRESNI